MVLRILHYGEPTLREKGALVTAFDNDLKQLVDDIIETIHNEGENCIGLAAHQVGRACQVTVLNILPVTKDNRGIDFDYLYDGKKIPLDVFMPLPLVNPKIEFTSEVEVEQVEACMSLPGIYGPVRRPEKIRISFQDLTGVPHTLECDGYLARLTQHEMDHLEGILIVDHMEPRVVEDLKPKLKQLKRASRDLLKKEAKAMREKEK